MAVLDVSNSFAAGTAIVASQMNTNFGDIETFVNTTPGVLQLTGGTVTGAVQLNNTLTLGGTGAGHDVKLWGDTTGDYLEWDADTNKLTIEGTNATTALHVTDGNVVVADTITADTFVMSTLTIEDATSPAVLLKDTGAADENSNPSGGFQVVANNNNTAMSMSISSGRVTFTNSDSGDTDNFRWRAKNSSAVTNTRMTLNAAGNLDIDGALSKGSGTFDIAHPTRGGDWRLRHSFIEGPQADLIYRGTVTLSGGAASVDLDAVSNMTDGTWEALNDNPWTLVASSGNVVEWSLSGKTLTVTSDTADAVCSWMVIGERQDDHIKNDSPIADAEGRLIVEYERPEEEEEEG